MENNVQDILYKHDKPLQKQILQQKPWLTDPKYFTHVKMSCIALIKILMHARKGNDIEVMGSLQGRIQDKTIYILDAFELPVEGTETRVSAQNEGYEYMVQYVEQAEKVEKLESVVGWYHSHPGYGCWLSGIDVGTQKLNQTYSEPFVAIVIDPKRTISAGKVEIGAFRTYPEGYKPIEKQELKSIPLNKIEDFGVHANQYYQLEISFFKSSFDVELLNKLWNKYWISTLSSTVSNWTFTSNQIKDVANKMGNQQNQFFIID